MCLVDWLANDLHYKSRGSEFYEKHLLADRVRDLGDDDEIKETYWLGFKNMNPPSDAEIAQMTIDAYGKISNESDIFIQLKKAFEYVIEIVERCKTEPSLPAGIHAILDGISQKALTYKFLMNASIG